MKNLFFIFSVLGLSILGGCASDTDFMSDGEPSRKYIPAAFSLDNVATKSVDNTSLGCDMVLSNDNPAITVSMEKEMREGKTRLSHGLKTSWTTANNQVKWTTGDRIGMFMRDAGGSNSYAKDNVLYTVALGGAATASLTADASPLYFPNKSSSIKFYAYYPYSASVSSLSVNYTLPADQSTEQALGSADIMYASPAAQNGSSPNVPLTFNHQMVLLSFNIKGGILSGLFTLTQVTVSGSAVTNTGVLNLATGTLTPNTASTFTATVNTSKPVSNTLVANVDVIINPCRIVNNSTLLPTELKVTLTFGLLSHSTYLVTSGTFAAGTRYVYNLNVAL